MKSYVIAAACALLGVSISQAQDRGIINTSKSPHVAMRSINIGDCRWTGGFWGDKFKLCADVMVPHMGTLLKGDVGHAYNNFKIAAGLMKGKHQGMHWHDGDFYKWMEAATYIYAITKDERIVKELDEIIAVIAKAQDEDGYLSTQIQLTGIPRFSNRQYHELYNAGHLLTAACIHYRVTGKRNFLYIAIKNADCLYRLFRPQPKELARFGFNQTQITGLVELYRTTGNKEYLHLAEIFVNMRGRSRPEPDPTVRYKMVGDMVQERTPLRKESEAVGHAVLALYYYAGAADIYAETGDKSLITALDRIWDNIVNKKMYITGACGQTHHGSSSHVDFVHEAFIREYMMPNLTAYNETCANICNAMFNYRLLGIHGASRYADIMELVLYNSGLSGISLDGKHYFYTNPLRRTHAHRMDTTDQETRARYIPCFCCPPNLVRTIAKASAWAYSRTDDGVAVNLFGTNQLDTHLADGSPLRLTQTTDYPWEGRIVIRIEQCEAKPFELLVRIPGWADKADLRVNGKPVSVAVEPGTYARLERQWRGGDQITLDLPMPVKTMEGDPRIEEVRNQVAIKRGPIVYCIESPDLPGNTGILDVCLSREATLTPVYDPQLLGGVTAIKTTIALRQDQGQGMYRVVGRPKWKRVQSQFVPYYAWSNRGRAEMTVFVPVIWGSL